MRLFRPALVSFCRPAAERPGTRVTDPASASVSGPCQCVTQQLQQPLLNIYTAAYNLGQIEIERFKATPLVEYFGDTYWSAMHHPPWPESYLPRAK